MTLWIDRRQALATIGGVVLAGCSGTSDEPAAVEVEMARGTGFGDRRLEEFETLVLSFEEITFRRDDAAPVDLPVAEGRVDLTELAPGESETVTSGQIPPGEYVSIDVSLPVREAVTNGGESVTVDGAGSVSQPLAVSGSKGTAVYPGESYTLSIDTNVQKVGDGWSFAWFWYFSE